MSRIRSIHPGLWTDEAFVSLSPMARLLLMGIWNECDDMGSFVWSPLSLKMRILPADNADAAALMAEMVEARAIVRYEIEGKSYGAVRNFCQFQRPKKPNSVHPQTDEIRKWVGTEARSTRDGSEGVGKRLPTDGGKSRQMEDGEGEGGRKNNNYQPPTKPRKQQTASDDAALAFSGRVIRLTAEDFERWRKAYPDIDLTSQLQSRDDWLVSEADERTRKRWFIATSNHLANLQQKARSLERSESQGMPC